MAMAVAKFIGGDWGTTHLRLFLCGEDPAPLEQVEGPGVNRVSGAFERALDVRVRGWTERHGELPIVLSGMVGSSVGWVQTPYLPCPFKPEQLASACIQLRNGRIRIVPGVSCRNRLDAPDYMRGEETQLLGALQLDPALREGRHLVCLPGSHTKWAILQDGSVQEFLTSPTGEISTTLCSQTTLVPAAAGNSKPEFSADGFIRAAQRVRRFPDAQLLHRLFESRSLRLSGELAADQAASYVSGLLIASDASGALRLFPTSKSNPVYVIGPMELCGQYSLALTTLGAETRVVDSAAAAVSGLAQIESHLRSAA
jgi:2-dehydro-3-deoxygalactonokinase